MVKGINRVQEMPDNTMIFEMINKLIGDLNTSITNLNNKIDREMEKNATRHLELTEKSTKMRGDIRMVSAKVAGIVSAAGIAIGWLMKKFGV